MRTYQCTNLQHRQRCQDDSVPQLKQIRNWEASGHIPKADRVQYGDRAYRRFSLKQVELISKIRELAR